MERRCCVGERSVRGIGRRREGQKLEGLNPRDGDDVIIARLCLVRTPCRGGLVRGIDGDQVRDRTGSEQSAFEG